MARRWCYFEFETEEEIENWYEAVDRVVSAQEERMGWSKGGRSWDEIEELMKKHRSYADLMRLRSFAEEADVGQRVVLNKRLYALAKTLGALPRRIRSFADCEEGIPGGTYEGPGREIVSGVGESTGVLLGMARKGEKRLRVELSRADIEEAIHRIDEEE